MRCDQVIDQRVDLIQIQLSRRVWVEHGGMVDMLALTGQRGLDRQRLHIHVGLHQRGQLRRQHADLGRLEAVLVDQAGYFDTAALRQVVE